METIYKYPFSTTDRFTLQMPVGAEILTVQTQNEIPCIWAKVDADLVTTEQREFRVYGTGHPIEEGKLKYIGTYQLHKGMLVFHLFEGTVS